MDYPVQLFFFFHPTTRRAIALQNHRTLGMDDQRAKKHLKADFACLVGLWYPHANPETYRVGVDWAAWVSTYGTHLVVFFRAYHKLTQGSN